METRDNEKIYLLDYDENQIVGCKLPSNGQILRVLFYNLRKVKLDLRSSAYVVVKEAEVLWNKAGIPVRQISRSVQKVENLYHDWKNLQKSCKRRTPLQVRREEEFVANLDNLFDIAHGDALDLIKIQEDKDFLSNQRREGSPGAMIGCDRLLFKKEKRTSDRIQKEMPRKEKHSEGQREINENFRAFDDEEDQLDFTDVCDDNIGDDPILHSQNNRKRRMKQFISPKLVATLDKCKVSDRDAVRILIATAEALGHDVNSLVISETSIRLCRKQFRSAGAEKLNC